MSNGTPVLVSWVAINNDPFERDFKTGNFRLVDEATVFGPTLTLLCDDTSLYANKVQDVVLLHRKFSGQSAEREHRVVQDTVDELKRRRFCVQQEVWQGEDPTDHRSIFQFMREKMTKIRKQYQGRELVLHVSPGTPSMHTVWVLMAETGYIEQPFTVVKSYRAKERGERPAVVPVEIGIETFYKMYKASRPRQVSSDEQGVIWDPGRFQTNAMKKVYLEASRFARLNVPILIRGERGTGKTTMAGWIRANSPFKKESLNKNWPSVACGQYSPETMRSELFGYKKGAFTGAVSDKKGLLATAHNDTLFLDEIGDISRDLQRLLIKAVEEKEYVALGDDTPKKSNFRLLTATNISHNELCERLDPDFFDRISLLTIDLPPLRDVSAELVWLWEAVYWQAAARAECSTKCISLGAAHHKKIVQRLQQHSLPGNLRDLFRVAYRILAARSDMEDRLSPGDAVEYGLAGLERSNESQANGSVELSRQVAKAFADLSPLDDILKNHQPLKTSHLISDYQAFISSEIRRIASSIQKKTETLCDISDRTLRNWACNGRPRK